MSWVFPGILFLVTVLVGLIWSFLRSEVNDLKDADDDNNKRFQALEAKIQESHNNIRDEAKSMVEQSSQRSDRDIELLRSDMRESMSQMREALRNTEQNILNQMNFLFRANKEG